MSKPPLVIGRRGLSYHPLKYLKSIDAANARANMTTVIQMPYPADPLVEPEYVGLTYLQVALIKQAEHAAIGSLESLEFFMDRMIGRPAQVNLNVNSNETYEQFLDRIAEEEKKTIDAEARELLEE